MSNTQAYDSLCHYAVSEKAGKEAFGPLRDVASDAVHTWETDSVSHPAAEGPTDLFLEQCLQAETSFMEVNYSTDPKAKTKAGSWKFRSYLPKAYSSAKSVLKRALEEGVDINGLGKSEIEKRTKEATSGNQQKCPDDVLKLGRTHLSNLLADIAALEAVGENAMASALRDEATSKLLSSGGAQSRW